MAFCFATTHTTLQLTCRKNKSDVCLIDVISWWSETDRSINRIVMIFVLFLQNMADRVVLPSDSARRRIGNISPISSFDSEKSFDDSDIVTQLVETRRLTTEQLNRLEQRIRTEFDILNKQEANYCYYIEDSNVGKAEKLLKKCSDGLFAFFFYSNKRKYFAFRYIFYSRYWQRETKIKRQIFPCFRFTWTCWSRTHLFGWVSSNILVTIK